MSIVTFRRLRFSLVLAMGGLGSALQGCASNGGSILSSGSLPGVTSFQEANAVAPQGYQFSGDGGDTLRVTATGSASTPNERLVKIALAAAAQHGAQQYKKYFRAGEPSYTVRCGKTSVVERGATRNISPSDYRVVTVDVTFAKTSTDPADRPTKETAAALLAELQAETIPQETQAALVAQLAQACGRSPQ
ncbi:MAG: hypothetical protein K2Q28_14955 [Hyphomicrobium sp.]|nr:hypothetical protein [Hyphomicrobium sp.]